MKAPITDEIYRHGFLGGACGAAGSANRSSYANHSQEAVHD
jgi:hypothetical protein